MTVFMTFVGLIVFMFSSVTAGFKTAFKRFGMFVLAGFVTDLLIAALAFTTFMVARY